MDITRTAAWKTVQDHAERLAGRHLRELFADDATRTEGLSFDRGGLLVDFSKQRIDRAALAALVELARVADVERWRDAMFAGERINVSENRAVLHAALRHRGAVFPRPDFDVMPEVRGELARLAEVAQRLRDGQWMGYSGQPIRHVVNIGIGGSDLGPKMATRALRAFGHPTLTVDYVSNIDGSSLAPILSRLDPRSTLFIVASKTFTTQETLANATTAREWLQSHAAASVAAGAPEDVRAQRLAEATTRHFLAVTAAPQKAIDFGVAPERVFHMWDWVGGRFSLWSAVGLPLMIAVGPRAFDELLAGAAAIDEEFCNRPLEENLPVLMALVGIWNIDFLGAETLAVLPYSESLKCLPAYLQQLEMESNGKTVARDGTALSCQANPIVWGEIGINGQHAFFQLLHQGGRLVPCDFIATAHADFPLPGHQEALLANCLAQSAALAFGCTADEARRELERQAVTPDQLERLLPHKVFPGNQPSTTILLSNLAPRQLGALLALYEHKVFVQGVVWGINSFDQFGVELGKALASRFLPVLCEEQPASGLDASTRRLIAYLLAHRAD